MADGIRSESTYKIYVLMEDVENPRSDKRVKYDWTRWTKWPKGTTFEIETIVPVVNGIRGEPREIIRKAEGVGKTHSLSLGRSIIQFDRLRPHLQPMEAETLGQILLKHHVSAAQVLNKLLASGRLTLDDVRQTLED